MRQRIVASFWSSWALAAALCLPAGAAELPKYQALDLGALGGKYSSASSINAAGQVTGSAQTPNGSWHAFRFTPGSPMEDLGTLDGLSGGGTAINDAGLVTGGATNADGMRRAFRATPGQPMEDLGTLGGDESWGFAINDAGQATGYARTADGRARAFLATPGQPMEDLGTLGGEESLGRDINAVGQVTGWAQGLGYSHAFRATPGQPMEDLGTVGEVSSSGEAINDAGQVAGVLEGPDAAFLYSDGSMKAIGTFGGPNTAVYDINELGHVVGMSEAVRGCEETRRDYRQPPSCLEWWGRAFVYRDGTMTNLGTLGGIHSVGFAINDVGQVAGAYYDWIDYQDEEPHAVLWTPISLLYSRLLDDVTGVGPGKSLAQKVRIATAYYDANDGPATCAMLRA
ncbi:MAG: extracellular repeat protein, family, partial [Deltaproteobacteria bacterium]|nr:extracellular repeat protein, family [Deltaproteobacteria bacterium]